MAQCHEAKNRIRSEPGLIPMAYLSLSGSAFWLVFCAFARVMLFSQKKFCTTAVIK